MSDIAIRCEGLSKSYQLGKQESYRALRDTIADTLTAPARYAQRLFRRNAAAEAEAAQQTLWALRDVSFDIKHGEVVGIIGRNGAGKSTLLKILSRITKPTTGNIYINGRVGSLLEVGTGFHPELTGRENIFLNGAILGMKRAEITRKFDEIVAFAEIEKFLDTPVKRYSSGMYVRLAFAVAAHLESELLIIDEVLAVGDAKFQRKCLTKLDEVSHIGRTVLFVSHDMAAVQLLCRKAMFLANGCLASIGPVRDQIESYLATAREQSGTLQKTLKLSEKLELREFSVTPNPVSSGSAAELRVALWSSEKVRLDDLTVMIFDTLGRRVSILDLRRNDCIYKTNGRDLLDFRIALNSLPLVEGEYRLGLWIDSSEVRKDFLDLLTLTVTDQPNEVRPVPHHPSLRGVIEMDFVETYQQTPLSTVAAIR